MYLLPGNPFSQAVEAYRDSGEAERFIQSTQRACKPCHPPIALAMPPQCPHSRRTYKVRLRGARHPGAFA